MRPNLIFAFWPSLNTPYVVQPKAHTCTHRQQLLYIHRQVFYFNLQHVCTHRAKINMTVNMRLFNSARCVPFIIIKLAFTSLLASPLSSQTSVIVVVVAEIFRREEVFMVAVEVRLSPLISVSFVSKNPTDPVSFTVDVDLR